MDEDAVRFQAENHRAGMFINPAACGPNVVLAISGTLEVRLKGLRILRRRIDYRRMPSDRSRTWHPLTYGRYREEYFRRLRASLVGGGIDVDGTCRSSSKFRSSLRRVLRALIRGKYMGSDLERRY